MPKPNPLTQGLERQPQPGPVKAKAERKTQRTPLRPAVRPSRTGRVLVGGHFAPEVQTALKVIAAEERTTVQALLAEAINLVFAKRHKPEIAEISSI
jgi:hypothetical protein